MRSPIDTIVRELGLQHLINSPRDAHLLILQRIFRLLAYGQSTLVLASYLHALGTSDFRIGLFMTLTLIGDVAGSFVLTMFADRWGRRKVLTLGCGLMVMSGVVFASTGSYFVLLLAAIIGVISPRYVKITLHREKDGDWIVPAGYGHVRQADFGDACSGNEIGPFKAIEESTLATLIPKDQRATIFAWYAVFSGLAAALGSLSGGWSARYLQSNLGWDELAAYRFIFAMYAVFGSIKGGLTLLLSDACEAKPISLPVSAKQTEEAIPMLAEGAPAENGGQVEVVAPRLEERRYLGLTAETLVKVRTLSCLFGLDNLASGLVPL